MTPDDINNDDEFEENFDVDDDFDDGLEEDWDDDAPIDDIPDMPGTETSGITDTMDSPEVTLPAGEKTFLQKFFMPIVIGIVALFGLVFAYGSGLLSGAAPVETQTTQDAQLANTQQNDAPPPVDVPMDAIQDELPDLPMEEANNAPLPEEPLTPLPGDETSAKEETFELVDLEAELQDENEAASEILNESPSPQDALPIEPTETLENTSNIDAADVLSVDAENIMPAPEELEVVNTETLSAVAQPVEIVADTTTEPSEASVAPSETTTPSPENNALKQQINEGHETIKAMRQEIAALKAQLENATQQAEESAATTIETTQKPDTPAVVDVIKETKQEATKVVNAPKKKVKVRKANKTIQWVLRSAQPGKATIAQANSNDMRTVEVGQTVSGLGRITAIQIENGLWVVRGTKSSVSQ